MINEKAIPLDGTAQENLKVEINKSIDWDALKRLTESFLLREAKLVAIFLVLIAMISPNLIADAQEFDDTFCSLRTVILEDAQNTTISCVDASGNPTEFTLEYLIYEEDVLSYTQDQMDNPPFLTSEYASTVIDPNYNCHSRTLQRIQEVTGVDFGASRETWLEHGLDSFMSQFADEVVRMDRIPNTFGEDVVEIDDILPGDVVLFFDNRHILLHSATVIGPATTEFGEDYLAIANKMGQGGELISSIDDIVKRFGIWGEHDDITNTGGGAVIVYRPRFDAIRDAFNTSEAGNQVQITQR